MPVIKISLLHLHSRLIYSLGDGIVLKFKRHFPEEFPHAFLKLMICSCLDWYRYLCVDISTHIQITVTIHNTNQGFCFYSSVMLLMCYCWYLSNTPLLTMLQRYICSYKLRLYQYDNISKPGTSLKTFSLLQFSEICCLDKAMSYSTRMVCSTLSTLFISSFINI